MATLLLDFQEVRLLPVTEGVEIFGGWLHTMMFDAKMDALAIGDDERLQGRVPLDEDWQVLGLYIDDGSAVGAVQQGWEKQQLLAFLPMASITASVGDPNPTGQMSGLTAWFQVWGRLWDGATHLQWDDRVGADLDPLVLRPCDPTWSVHRWPAGMLWRLESWKASTVGFVGARMQVRFILLRMPRVVQGVDVRRPLAMLDAALKALQASARREVLRD